MNTTTFKATPVTSVASSRPTPAAAQPPRMDLYTTIHKALRQFMADTLVRIGSMDIDDANETDGALQQLGALLTMLRSHLAHENTFVHAAIEQRRPGAQRRLSQDHDEHLVTIDEIDAQAQALRKACLRNDLRDDPRDGPRDDKHDAAALRLYRHLAQFIAENFEHMHVEETSNQALLWALFSDAELIALHERLLASVPMPEMAVVLRWMASSLNFKELANMLGAMQSGMPPEAFRGVLDLVQAQMSATRWGRLAAHLGVPQVPGLVAYA